MIAKEITYKELESAIRIAFENDKEIIELYDPRVNASSINEIVEDILKKVKDHGTIQLKGVYDKGELIGFYVRGKGMLMSFGLAVKYRVRKFKRHFFDLIKRDFKGTFICFLWSVNVRAIKWLEKNDMKVVASDSRITKLIYNG